MHFRFEHLSGKHTARISRLDRDHGDIHPAYQKMGQPRYPTPEQLKSLRNAAQMPAPEIRKIVGGELTLDLPPDGLAIIEVK